MNIQSGELLHTVSACVISKMRCIKSVEMGGGLFFWSSNVYSFSSVLCCLSGNNGFLFIPPAHGWGLSQFLCFLPYYFLLFLRAVQRHEFDIPQPRSPFSFVSISVLSFSSFPPFCQLLSTAPSCLHIAWSETTKLKLAALVFSPSLPFPFSAFFFHICPSWLVCE